MAFNALINHRYSIAVVVVVDVANKSESMDRLILVRLPYKKYMRYRLKRSEARLIEDLGK